MGRLPLDYLNGSQAELARATYANTREILQQYETKHGERREAAEFIFLIGLVSLIYLFDYSERTKGFNQIRLPLFPWLTRQRNFEQAVHIGKAVSYS